MDFAAVVFDLDDTLVVDKGAARRSLLAAAELAPDTVADDLVDAVFRSARSRWRSSPHHQVCQDLGVSSREGLWSSFEGCHPVLSGVREWAGRYRAGTWQAALAELGIDNPVLADEMAAVYAKAQQSSHDLTAGAEGLLAGLTGHVKIGLLTNGPADIQRIKVNHAGLDHHFDTIAISGEIGIGKPDPEVFARVLSELGASPAETVMVGDSWQRDIVGATRSGWSAIWISGGRQTPDDLDGVNVVHDLTEVAALLDR